MAKKAQPGPGLLRTYENVISAVKGLERKGSAMPYTSVNGHMFSFIDKEGALSLRLSKDDLESFIKKYKTTNAVQHGVVMKEYALVPAALFERTKEMQAWFKKSFDM